MLSNANALLPLIAAEADDIEAGARLTPRAAAAMRAAGVFEMSFPASRGGLEMTLEQQVDIVALIAAVDASAAWHVGVLNAGGCYAGRLGDEAYAELYPTRDRPTSGSFHPRGRAERVDGGYLVSGRWDWGSGSYVADHVIGGCFAFEDDRPVLVDEDRHLLLGVWLPSEAIVSADNWHTLGLRGSGSTSYAIDTPVFVPERYTFDRDAPYDPHADPLNKSVKITHFTLGGVVLRGRPPRRATGRRGGAGGAGRPAVRPPTRPCCSRWERRWARSTSRSVAMREVAASHRRDHLRLGARAEPAARGPHDGRQRCRRGSAATRCCRCAPNSPALATSSTRTRCSG